MRRLVVLVVVLIAALVWLDPFRGDAGGNQCDSVRVTDPFVGNLARADSVCHNIEPCRSQRVVVHLFNDRTKVIVRRAGGWVSTNGDMSEVFWKRAHLHLYAKRVKVARYC